MEGYPITTDIVVRFRDLDAMGHVNNAVYLTYFEEGRVAYFKAATEGKGIKPEAFSFVVAEVKCLYHSPAFLSEKLVVGTRAADVGNKSFKFEYRIEEVKTGRLVASGYSVQVSYDYTNHRPVPLPSDFLEKIVELQGSVPYRKENAERG